MFPIHSRSRGSLVDLFTPPDDPTPGDRPPDRRTGAAPESPPESGPESVAEAGDLLQWHGAWALAVLIAFVSLAVALKGLPWNVVGALAGGAAPGVAGLLLRGASGRRIRAALLVLWAICGAAACLLAGGISGPLAVWCLAPVAAAAAFGGASLMAEAAALSLTAAGAVALAGLAGLAPLTPAAPVDFWLGFLGLLTTGLGLVAGLALARRRDLRRQTVRRAAGHGLERLLSDQPYLILALTPSGEVQAAFGHSPVGVDNVGLPGRNLQDFADVADLPAVRSAMAAARAGSVGACQFAPRHAPDRTCALEMRSSSEGGLVAVIRDASAERAREAGLEAAREAAETLNAGKSRFLANMSHELRTPLNAIMGFSDVMKSKLFGELQPKYAEYAEMIHDAGGHLLDLINDVLDISKIEAERYELHREVFDAREAVSSALRLTRLQADAAAISLRGLLPPRPLEVNADSRAIKQIVLNLISNALKFTPRGGSVTVTVGGHGQDLEIIVSDTGVGIAEADLQRLGRPYEQAGDNDRKGMGTGLGLSLVRSFSELHGGGMSLESRLGEGTSVTVRMPVLLPQASREPPQPQQSAQIIAFNPGGKLGG